jgi:cytochrome c556
MLGAAVVAAVFASTVVYAQEEIIRLRQSLMQVNQNSVELAYAMSEGDVPWDAAIAKNALLAIASDNEIFPSLFPDNTNVKPTHALPTVWSNKAGFTALSMKMAADARAAAADATSADILSASKAFAEVQKNCTTCHTQFRAPL